MSVVRRTIVVQKTRGMIADELADALKAADWERRELRKLRTETLTLLAVATIPAWHGSVEVST